MVKGKMNDIGWANDVKVIQKGKKIIRRKNPTKYCNGQKWANTKRGPTNETPWHVPLRKWIINKSPMWEWWLKKRGSHWA